MECRIEERADCIVVTPVGRIDGSTVASFMDTLLGAVRNGTLPVVLDAQELTFINSAGLRVLIIAKRDLDRRDQPLTIRSLRPAVDSLIHLAGLDRFLEVRP